MSKNIKKIIFTQNFKENLKIIVKIIGNGEKATKNIKTEKICIYLEF